GGVHRRSSGSPCGHRVVRADQSSLPEDGQPLGLRLDARRHQRSARRIHPRDRQLVALVKGLEAHATKDGRAFFSLRSGQDDCMAWGYGAGGGSGAHAARRGDSYWNSPRTDSVTYAFVLLSVPLCRAQLMNAAPLRQLDMKPTRLTQNSNRPEAAGRRVNRWRWNV